MSAGGRIARVVGGVVSAATCATVAVAQRPGGLPLPAAAPARAYVFPRVQTQRLPNGLVVEIVEDHALPLVAVRAVIDGGALLEPAGKEGLFLLDTLLVRDGTASMTGDSLAEAIEDLGAPLSPTRFTSVAGQFGKSLALMGEMLMRPTFPAAALERRRAAVTALLQRAEGQPATPAIRIFNHVVFGPGHPLARTVTAASLASITRDDVARFHDEHVRPQNVTLVIVGDLTPASAMPVVTRVFGRWQAGGERAVVTVPPARAPHPTTIYLFDRPGAPQSTIRIGQAGPARSSPDSYALEVASAILGGPTGSRLSLALRERRSLTYGVTHGTAWRRLEIPSSIIGQANVDAAKTDSALIVWLAELKDITGARPPTGDEMIFGRSVTVGNLATRLETFDAVANQIAQMALDHLPMTYMDEYVRRIDGLTTAQVAAAASRYIDPAHTAIVVVGDRKTLEPTLRAANIAPVVVVDGSGNVQP